MFISKCFTEMLYIYLLFVVVVGKFTGDELAIKAT